ncbi:MAG TPA: hypothetical protein VJ836_01610 [Candidatus Saccharimonadales bacterium]|nr:hypothetical protein [Candidatus Saccharimonadales bacterium]
MNLKKPLLIAGAATAVGLAGIVGMGVASAATDSASGIPTLAEKIATKFNLNKDEVQAVFDEEKVARHAEMQKHMEERLSQAVTDGKLTAEQKDKILAKLQELHANRESERASMQDMTAEERKKHMQSKHAELRQWAEDNGINEKYLPIVKMRHHHGPMSKEMFIHKSTEPTYEQ